MKSIGIIRPIEKTTITAEGATYTEAKAALEAAIPDGYELIAMRYED